MSKLSKFIPLFIIAQALIAKSEFSWIEKRALISIYFTEIEKSEYVYERIKPEDRERTYKPFYHLYDIKGEKFVTKGPGGKFTPPWHLLWVLKMLSS